MCLCFYLKTLQTFYFFKVFYIIRLLKSVISLKVVSATFLIFCFVCLKESTCETRKNVFYLTSKALFVLEIIFNFPDIQMSGRHQMPKHETRNTRNTRITWEVKHSLVMKFGQLESTCDNKENLYQKII